MVPAAEQETCMAVHDTVVLPMLMNLLIGWFRISLFLLGLVSPTNVGLTEGGGGDGISTSLKQYFIGSTVKSCPLAQLCVGIITLNNLVGTSLRGPVLWHYAIGGGRGIIELERA